MCGVLKIGDLYSQLEELGFYLSLMGATITSLGAFFGTQWARLFYSKHDDQQIELSNAIPDRIVYQRKALISQPYALAVVCDPRDHYSLHRAQLHNTTYASLRGVPSTIC